MRLTLRRVRPWGRPSCDVAIEDGTIVAIGQATARADQELDGGGGVLLPGLHDHHLHILALAARRRSVDLAGMLDPAAIAAALRATPGGTWVRAVGYDERAAGLPDAALLDRWLPDLPCRLQDRTGALWVLNTPALRLLGDRTLPPGAERDAAGRATGRFWREDAWLRDALPTSPPDPAAIGPELARLGLTTLTDATATNGPAEARLLAGALPQRLHLMGSEALPLCPGYTRGPLKLLIDERDPPDPAALAARIRQARGQGRAVAAHCVTAGELALYLAALTAAGGARPGDRIEHGSIVPPGFMAPIVAAGLTVVTNPGFLHDRGDRYRTEVAPADLADLYRIGSLRSAGIAMRAGSDAPFADVDPWLGMRAARDRRTKGGASLSPAECIDARRALRLYCDGAVAVGAPADLILCQGTWADVLADLTAERVRLTLIAGTVVYAA